MKNYICIDGKKTEISCETAENLKKQFGKPEIRHGDYGYWEDRQDMRRVFVRIGNIVKGYNQGGECMQPDANAQYACNYTILGNIFDIKAKDC